MQNNKQQEHKVAAAATGAAAHTRNKDLLIKGLDDGMSPSSSNNINTAGTPITRTSFINFSAVATSTSVSASSSSCSNSSTDTSSLNNATRAFAYTNTGSPDRSLNNTTSTALSSSPSSSSSSSPSHGNKVVAASSRHNQNNNNNKDNDDDSCTTATSVSETEVNTSIVDEEKENLLYGVPFFDLIILPNLVPKTYFNEITAKYLEMGCTPEHREAIKEREKLHFAKLVRSFTKSFEKSLF